MTLVGPGMLSTGRHGRQVVKHVFVEGGGHAANVDGHPARGAAHHWGHRGLLGVGVGVGMGMGVGVGVGMRVGVGVGMWVWMGGGHDGGGCGCSHTGHAGHTDR